MLKKLIIKNVALIDGVEIEFDKELNILSGETGAGKSVILESLNFVLGAKADKTLIRSGETECSVTAEFSVCDNDSIKAIYEETGIEYDDTLIINRKYTVDGKSTIRLNGETINVSILKKFTQLLVDVHGQSEHYSLLKISNQLKLIDKFGGNDIVNKKAEISTLFLEYKKILADLKSLGGDESERIKRLDILNYQIKEINDANVKENEEEELSAIKQKLLHAEKISNSLSSVKDALSGENGVNDILSNLTKVVSQISNLTEDFSSIADRINGIYAECVDIADTADNLLDGMDSFEYNIDSVESRLDVVKLIKKKYGATITEVNEFLEKAVAEKEKLENFNEIAGELIVKKEKTETRLYGLYTELSKIRRKYAEDFSNKVLEELKTLGMNRAQFVVNFNQPPVKENCKFDSSNGYDELEFLFSANAGEPVKSLSMIISGGEMSRFMLAIKAQTAVYNEISTFIFDEIDAGISGNIASVVAEKFVKISRKVQVIAISHLAQISAVADNNVLIVKIETSNKTVTTVKKLDEDGKVTEITRLIGGDIKSKSAVAHAKELIENANKLKKSL